MRRAWVLPVIAVVAVLTLAGAPLLGAMKISLREIIHADSGSAVSAVFWSVRVPRVLVAFLGGAALAASGLAFQAMFRNPLASESTLGAASGASLGAAISVRLGLSASVLGIPAVSLFAFLGAMLSVSLVYGITRVKRGLSMSTMLLAGMAVNLFCSSLVLCVQSVSDFHNSFRLLHWLMGGLGAVGYDGIWRIVPFFILGSGVVLYLTRELNLLTMGDDIALSRGVDVNRVRTVLFLATSLMVGGVVSVCGPIGFVGLIVPHICRLSVGPDHRRLIPSTILLGAAFLTACDTIARLITIPAELPVGVITSLLGGPFFLWLLLGSKQGVGEM